MSKVSRAIFLSMVVALTSVIAMAAADDTPKISVSFISPSQGSMVREFVDVRYEVRGELPAGYQPVLFVKHTSGEYVSWGTSSSNAHSRVQLGGERMAGATEGPPGLFELVVVITQEPPRIGERIRRLPKNIASATVRVERK